MLFICLYITVILDIHWKRSYLTGTTPQTDWGSTPLNYWRSSSLNYWGNTSLNYWGSSSLNYWGGVGTQRSTRAAWGAFCITKTLAGPGAVEQPMEWFSVNSCGAKDKTTVYSGINFAWCLLMPKNKITLWQKILNYPNNWCEISNCLKIYNIS